MMSQDQAYSVMMGFATGLKLPARMRRHSATDWRVTVEPTGEDAMMLSDLVTAREVYKRLRAQMRLPL